MVSRKKTGFTLIEIVLVMAVSGMILVMVFMALSGAQRGRRDTQRKNDLSRLGTQIESYGSNHSGIFPPDLASLGSYTPAEFTDPSSGTGYLSIPSGTGHITYQLGAGTACDGTTTLSNTRQFVLHITLENGIGCRDNL